MHDEATPHYIDLIDQTTLGHRFILDEFGKKPRVGWQIDPFGHSAVQAYLLGAEIFTGIFPIHYEPPEGFTFEINDVSAPIQDDDLLFDYNVQQRVDDFVAAAVAQANLTRTNHIMWTMGTDFRYQYAVSWFRQMDKFIHYVNLVCGSGECILDWLLTSRPALKGYVRMLSGYYLAARQLEFFKGRYDSGPSTDALADALAIAQHHDAVSGTERQHVAADYALRLSIGYKECPLLNISYCPPSEANFSDGKSLVIIAYNPLGWRRVEVIRIPEGRSNLSSFLFSNVSLLNVNYHIKAYLGISASSSARYWLAFSVSVPPLGFSTYVVSSAKPTESRSIISTVYTPERGVDKTFEVGQGNLKLLYSVNEGKLKRYTNRRNSVAAIAEHSYSYYTGYNGTDRVFQASGAYVFRPNETFPIKTEGQVPLTVMRGPLLDEVHQQLNTWLYQVTRVYKGKEHAEVEFTVRDYRADWDLEEHQPIAGNYYPINLGIYLEDETMEVSVLVDRAVGGSSLVDGQIELMLHRRLLNDDSRGVGEALNEEVCILENCKGLTVQGKFYLRIDPRGEGAKWRRTFGQEVYSPLLLAFSQEEGSNWINSRKLHFQLLINRIVYQKILRNFRLAEFFFAWLTYMSISQSHCIVFRTCAKTGEDKDYSVVTGVELKKLFPDKKIMKVAEMSLSANQERMEMEKKRLDWKVEGDPEGGKVVRGGPVDPVKLVVELAPMEIRTFIIDLNYLKVFGS
ncbi:UNVERIFIED_CONTAM: Alpha-mannosidase [Sesamum angustifolium]|uniref:Alpha-mannosidase n=1 Tax=Sesamum angustifolium TaxID=2727405 RepID=A0AAW2NK41_9LAMI